MPTIRRLLVAGLSLSGALALCAPREAAAQRSRCRAREVSLSPPDGRVAVNAVTPILATTYDGAGNPCDNVTYTWASGSPSVATVDHNGMVRGVAIGTATITARYGSGAAAKVGRATVTVVEATSVTTQANPGDSIVGLRRRDHPAGQGTAAMDIQPDGSGPADNLIVEPLQVMLIRGERKRLDVRALRADGSPAAPVPIVFQVVPGGERIATVDTFGTISALSDTGTATVNLTVPNQSRVQQRIVRVSVRSDSVVFSPRELTLAPGMVETLSVYVPAQQRAVDDKLFQYASSDATRLQVNPGRAIVTAVAPGEARITGSNAFLPDINATVHVHRRVRAVTVGPATGTLPADSTVVVPIGGSVALRAHALAADDGSEVPESPITWTAPGGGIVSLDTAHVVRGLRSGLVTVSVATLITRDSAARASLKVKVVAGGLVTSRSRIGLGMGEHSPLDVTMMDEQRRGVGSALPYMRWTSSDTAVATVQADQVVAHLAGHTRLEGRTGWDSLVHADVWVVGELLVSGRFQGHPGLLMLHNGQPLAAVGSDSLVLFSAWSPDLTRIAYTAAQVRAGREGGSSLFLMNADGTGRVQLTPGDSNDANLPVFTPGGTQLLFDWDRGGRAQIWKGDLRGDSLVNLTQVTSNPAGNSAPAVSPDGRRIAYVSLRAVTPGRQTFGIYTAGLDGSDEKMVVNLPQGFRIYSSPVFTRDGAALLFVRGEPSRGGLPTQRVVRIGVNATPADTVVALTPPDRVVRAFSISPDGTMLALNTLEALGNSGNYNTHLLLFPLNGGAVQSLDTPEMRPLNPVFRPATPQVPAAGLQR